MTAPLVVQRNPLITDVTDADLHGQYQFGRQVRDKATEANEAVIAIRRVKAQVDDRLKQLEGPRRSSAPARPLVTNASDVEEKIYQVKNQSGQDPLNFPIRVNNRLANLLSMSERGDGPPDDEHAGDLRDPARRAGGVHGRAGPHHEGRPRRGERHPREARPHPDRCVLRQARGVQGDRLSAAA